LATGKNKVAALARLREGDAEIQPVGFRGTVLWFSLTARRQTNLTTKSQARQKM